MWLEIILALLIIIIVWQSAKKPSNYPPGPWGFPLFGFLPSSYEDYEKKLSVQRKKYGDVIGWRIGTRFIVSVFDYNLFKEAYQNPDISSRPDLKTLIYLQDDNILGIISSSGTLWQNNRRFALRHLRDFGMSKTKLLPVALNEADFIVNELKKQLDYPAPLPVSLMVSALNVLWQMVGNRRYDLNDEEIQEYCKLVHETRRSGPTLIILDIFPWIKTITPNFILNYLFKFDNQTRLSNSIKKYFRKYIDIHLEELDEENPKGYIDAYLLEMKKQKLKPDSTMSIDDLIYCLSDLFEGGTETTSTSVHWALLYLAKFPQVQKRLQKEIDEILPNGTEVTLDDKARLPYTEAFMHETLRFSSLAVSPPRSASNETKIGNYVIPKGTFVMGQLYSMHYDSRYFDNPEIFRPERFLDSDGNFSTPRDGFVPFGSGKRVCLGEIVARTSIFVFITKLVQNFHFEFPVGEEHNLEGAANPFVRMPKGSSNLLIRLR